MSRTKPPIDGDVLELVASGRATTRAAIARALDLAPSTISGVVARLLEAGVIRDGGEAESTGGRPGNILRPSHDHHRTFVAELSAHHARIGLADRGGTVANICRCDLDIADGPRKILHELIARGEALANETSTTLTGIGIAVPGPVDTSTGTVVGPSRMPGWNGCNVPEIVGEFSELPLLVENDAQIGARGEYAFRLHSSDSAAPFRDFIYIKAGSAIGAALVQDGTVYRGARGVAGDITHVRVESGGHRPCQCGNTGCLDTVSSAEAVRQDLAASGFTFASNDELIDAALDGNPEVVTMIRAAGVTLGEAIARNISFLAPEALVIGGTLSAVDAFAAGVRQSLHERCLHVIMEHIAIENSQSGMDAALWGLADAINTTANSHVSTQGA